MLEARDGFKVRELKVSKLLALPNRNRTIPMSVSVIFIN